ncbi:FAD-dependent oxidoreductase, partial [Palaeococcus sp. (in: euryarchaeotes)]
MVKVTINGKEFDVPEEKPLIEFLREITHIPGFCYNEAIDPYGSCRLCLVKTARGITTSCTLKPTEGLSIETLSDEVIEMRRTALELILSDHYGDCIGPCQQGCPAHSDVQGYLALIAMERYHDAVKLMKEKFILPAVLGRVCPAFCEDECRRNLVDEPLAIRQLKRFAADYDLEHGPWMPEIPPSTGKRVAVVGGGPAGLACAYYLRTMGHEVTIIEAMPQLGGMMRYGIPPYRLPRDILDKDIKTVIDTGIEVKTNTALGRDITLNELREKYDAVFLGIGAWKSRKMRIEGEELEGVMHGIEFLRKVNMGEEVKLGERVIVVGGGNTAMDVARTALRLGAEVTVVYRRSRKEMPANPREVEEAEEEGVKFMFLTNPVKIIGKEKVEEVELIKMKLGEPDASGRRRPIPIEGS